SANVRTVGQLHNGTLFCRIILMHQCRSPLPKFAAHQLRMPRTCYSERCRMHPDFQPMPLLKRRLPFDDADWLFELKYDGFRALAVIEHGRAQLLSRNGHPFASFSDFSESIYDSLSHVRAFIDGVIYLIVRLVIPYYTIL